MATKTTPTKTTMLDGLELLRADHLTVEKIFQRLERLPKASPTKASLVRKLVRELSIHAVIEEQILYPILRSEIENGAPLADHALDEHLEVKQALAELERLKMEDEDFDTVLLGLMDDVRQHVAEEEGDLFPKLRKILDEQRLHDLAMALNQAKKVAPTHPHPNAPDQPPGNIIAGMPVAMLDRAMDVGKGVMHFGMGVAQTVAETGIRVALTVVQRMRR